MTSLIFGGCVYLLTARISSTVQQLEGRRATIFESCTIPMTHINEGNHHTDEGKIRLLFWFLVKYVRFWDQVHLVFRVHTHRIPVTLVV